jgi:hypothetical protein
VSLKHTFANGRQPSQIAQGDFPTLLMAAMMSSTYTLIKRNLDASKVVLTKICEKVSNSFS